MKKKRRVEGGGGDGRGGEGAEEGKDGRGRKGRRERRKTGKVRMSSCSNVFCCCFLETGSCSVNQVCLKL